MKVHREKKEMPVYNLSVASAGKLPPPHEGNCVGSDPRQPPPQPALGKRMLTACGSILMPVTPSGAALHGGKVRMAALVSRLTEILGRPVIDKTGFSATFDLDLKFALDDTLAGTPFAARSGLAQPSDPSGLPTLSTALREQLGLKIESAKAPVEVLVIDSVERPSAN